MLFRSQTEKQTYVMQVFFNHDSKETFQDKLLKVILAEELTAPIVNELISKIVVHSPEKRYSRKHVTIEVFFTYVGKIRIPINIENMEDVDIA